MSNSGDNPPLASDPTNRYVHYGDLLGKGAYKTVYSAIDTELGITVAWNEIYLDNDVAKDHFEGLLHEIRILQRLEHPNIIRFYTSWLDREKHILVFITECMTSGTLKNFVNKARRASSMENGMRNWCRQILLGLQYLHTCDPPIIHRDIKCENIFIDSTTGCIKIGDLGLAKVCRKAQPTATYTVIGTPEFMAPEFYAEDYDVGVDIWAFGMCLIEMATGQYPYAECDNSAQVYKRVSTGVLPNVLTKDLIKNPAMLNLISQCLLPRESRPSAALLLEHDWIVGKSVSPGPEEADDGSEVDKDGDASSAGPSTAVAVAPLPQDPHPPSEDPRLVADPVVMAVPSPALEPLPEDGVASNAASVPVGPVKFRLIAHLATEVKSIHWAFNPATDDALVDARELVGVLQLPAVDPNELRDIVMAHVNNLRTGRNPLATNAAGEIEITLTISAPPPSTSPMASRIEEASVVDLTTGATPATSTGIPGGQPQPEPHIGTSAGPPLHSGSSHASSGSESDREAPMDRPRGLSASLDDLVLPADVGKPSGHTASDPSLHRLFTSDASYMFRSDPSPRGSPYRGTQSANTSPNAPVGAPASEPEFVHSSTPLGSHALLATMDPLAGSGAVTDSAVPGSHGRRGPRAARMGHKRMASEDFQSLGAALLADFVASETGGDGSGSGFSDASLGSQSVHGSSATQSAPGTSMPRVTKAMASPATAATAAPPPVMQPRRGAPPEPSRDEPMNEPVMAVRAPEDPLSSLSPGSESALESPSVARLGDLTGGSSEGYLSGVFPLDEELRMGTLTTSTSSPSLVTAGGSSRQLLGAGANLSGARKEKSGGGMDGFSARRVRSHSVAGASPPRASSVMAPQPLHGTAHRHGHGSYVGHRHHHNHHNHLHHRHNHHQAHHRDRGSNPHHVLPSLHALAPGSKPRRSSVSTPLSRPVPVPHPSSLWTSTLPQTGEEPVSTASLPHHHDALHSRSYIMRSRSTEQVRPGTSLPTTVAGEPLPPQAQCLSQSSSTSALAPVHPQSTT